jgi:processing peptidase subunit alpha
LEGGIKAACLDSTTPNTSVAVFVGGGAAAETAETAGASKLLEYMAFSATKNRCAWSDSLASLQEVHSAGKTAA